MECFQTELLSGQGVVHHQDIPGKNGIGNDRHLREGGAQGMNPCRVFGAGKGTVQRRADRLFPGGCIEYRSDDKDQTLFPLLFKGDSPLHADG